MKKITKNKQLKLKIHNLRDNKQHKQTLTEKLGLRRKHNNSKKSTIFSKWGLK